MVTLGFIVWLGSIVACALVVWIMFKHPDDYEDD